MGLEHDSLVRICSTERKQSEQQRDLLKSTWWLPAPRSSSRHPGIAARGRQGKTLCAELYSQVLLPSLPPANWALDAALTSWPKTHPKGLKQD